jgi:hypothetical protein
MKAVSRALCWLLMVGTVAAGLLGAISYRIPAAGLVVGPTLLWIGARHGVGGLALLWGAMTGRLEMESWPEAREVVSEVRRFGIAAGVAASIASAAAVLTAPELLHHIGLQVLLHATGPVLIALGLSVAIWRPLEAHLVAGYGRWLSALREALTPLSVDNTPPTVELPAPIAPRVRRTA